jgi:hypothetical protein
LSGRCPPSRVGLPIPMPKGEEPTHARCGHFPHHTLGYGRRLLPLPHAENEIRTRGVSLCKRGDHPGYLRPLVQVRQREGLLPLRSDQPALSAFPTLPNRTQFNRCVRSCTELIEAFVLHLRALLQTSKCSYEALESSAMPARDCKRRGHGWMAGQADIGWSNSLG